MNCNNGSRFVRQLQVVSGLALFSYTNFHDNLLDGISVNLVSVSIMPVAPI